MGRPTKKTQESQDAIVKALERGYTRAAAAAYAGMTYETFRVWEHEDSAFSAAVEKAEGTAQGRLIDKIAADKSWQASAWMLERRWPKEYARRESVEMSGPDGGPIDHRDVTKLPDHEKQALAAAIRDHLSSQRPRVPAGVEPDTEPGG